MPTFPDLATFRSEMEGEPLVLPVNGVTYSFPASIPARTALALVTARAIAQRVTAGEMVDPAEIASNEAHAGQVLDDLLAPELDRMLANGLTQTDLNAVGETLMAWHMGGADMALNRWQGKLPGGDARPPALSASSQQPTSPSSSTRRQRKRSKTRQNRV
ncbi:DUF7426 family protein [Actinosynnema mirum]|uniref:DUF7426 domain-containing protein n=1 Tax=Actinosynnema mirum (strain ATCC 29888 / DSM 43827 / JCM 3225 / NBRC 14064 / NCIMB 13271 / NRRL B-12336 / IMRU 3971 / 101) TaxID=446462 RepID=C6WBL4_ACTMD|nr:hypothetical protein [Actinosynnema mirum]ACU35582.1 hypothetical protein Amir_1633 [Actinosynnema mirum DSM 43827]